MIAVGVVFSSCLALEIVGCIGSPSPVLEGQTFGHKTMRRLVYQRDRLVETETEAERQRQREGRRLHTGRLGDAVTDALPPFRAA